MTKIFKLFLQCSKAHVGHKSDSEAGNLLDTDQGMVKSNRHRNYSSKTGATAHCTKFNRETSVI